MVYPIFTLVFVTLLFIYSQAFFRIYCVVKKKVSVKYFRYCEFDDQVPLFILRGAKHYSNLFETPILFYLAALMSLVLEIESFLMVTLAWIYVFSRVLHGVIHIAFNHILYRMLAFQLSLLSIVGLWLMLVIKVQYS